MSTPEGDGVIIPIGGNLSPLEKTFAEAVIQAKQTGGKVQEALGLEGLKGERGLKTQVQGFFKDIAGGADIGTAAMSRLGESFRMTAGTLVAFAAVQYLGETLMTGIENARKFGAAVKDSLSISDDNSAKSLAQMDEEIQRLKEDVQNTNLGSMTALGAGTEVLVQAIENGKSYGDALKDDLNQYYETTTKLHAEEDASASRRISDENEVLRLKLSGAAESADRRKDELDDEEKMRELERKGDQDAIAALQQQIILKAQLREQTGEEKSAKALAEQEKKAQEKIDATNEQASKMEKKAAFDALTDQQKLAYLDKRVKAAEAIQNNANSSPQQKADARLIIAQTDEQKDQVGKDEEQKNLEIDSLKKEQADAQNRLREATADALGFHGQVSSLRREGFAGAVGPNKNGEQLRAAAEANKHLQELNNKMAHLLEKEGIPSI